jgi:anti-sigma regulatory factor (Ser/Thr protein kinase)
MTGGRPNVRLLPWAGVRWEPSLLVTDADGTVSRLAERIEDLWLARAEQVLGQAREAGGRHGLSVGELDDLTDALHDALLVAECRGVRLGGAAAHPVVPHAEQPGTRAVFGGRNDAAQAFSLLALPGHDLASARTARRHVRDAARSWGLTPDAADDLETIAGELVANAVEHSDSRTIAVTCALTAESATLSVTDEGGKDRTPEARPSPPRPEQEHGRGLFITDALSGRWGIRRTRSGLTVWAEIPVGAATARTAPPG